MRRNDEIDHDPDQKFLPLYRWWRVATLILPSVIAAGVVLGVGHSTSLVEAASQALVPLWLVTLGSLLVRSIEAAVARRRSLSVGRRVLAQLDVLTASGCAIAWTASGAVVLSVVAGWASLAVVGLFGLGILQVVVTWTALVAGGDEPWRRAEVTRKLVPAMAIEGDAVKEELRLVGVRIPSGFRLFARARLGRRWPTSRHMVDAAESGGEVLLESDLGPALRGEHNAPPVELWLGDAFGLCRTAVARHAPAQLTVLPRPGRVENAKQLLGRGGDAVEVIQTRRLPTEGSFRLREYQPGDDARRIHWPRSLSARQLVVRLPDEVPPQEPAVRLVLDTFLPGADHLATDAPAEVLDALVRVWLGVGQSLARSGTKVVLVTAARRRSSDCEGETYSVSKVERPLMARSPQPALQLGATVAWQSALPVASLLSGDQRHRTLIVSCRPQPGREQDARWIVVPEVLWTNHEPRLQRSSFALLPHSIGSPDNRLTRRVREKRRLEAMRHDGLLFDELCRTLGQPLPGSFIARPASGNEVRDARQTNIILEAAAGGRS